MNSRKISGGTPTTGDEESLRDVRHLLTTAFQAQGSSTSSDVQNSGFDEENEMMLFAEPPSFEDAHFAHDIVNSILDEQPSSSSSDLRPTPPPSLFDFNQNEYENNRLSYLLSRDDFPLYLFRCFFRPHPFKIQNFYGRYVDPMANDSRLSHSRMGMYKARKQCHYNSDRPAKPPLATHSRAQYFDLKRSNLKRERGDSPREASLVDSTEDGCDKRVKMEDVVSSTARYKDNLQFHGTINSNPFNSRFEPVAGPSGVARVSQTIQPVVESSLHRVSGENSEFSSSDEEEERIANYNKKMVENTRLNLLDSENSWIPQEGVTNLDNKRKPKDKKMEKKAILDAPDLQLDCLYDSDESDVIFVGATGEDERPTLRPPTQHIDLTGDDDEDEVDVEGYEVAASSEQAHRKSAVQPPSDGRRAPIVWELSGPTPTSNLGHCDFGTDQDYSNDYYAPHARRSMNRFPLRRKVWQNTPSDDLPSTRPYLADQNNVMTGRFDPVLAHGWYNAEEDVSPVSLTSSTAVPPPGSNSRVLPDLLTSSTIPSPPPLVYQG